MHATDTVCRQVPVGLGSRSSPASQLRHDIVTVSKYCPLGHGAHADFRLFGASLSGQIEHATPPAEIFPTGQAVQLDLRRSGAVPTLQRSHTPASPAYPSGHDSQAVRASFGRSPAAQSTHSRPFPLTVASPTRRHDVQPSAPPLGGLSPPAGSCGCSPALHDKHSAPAKLYVPYAQMVQLVRPVSTS